MALVRFVNRYAAGVPAAGSAPAGAMNLVLLNSIRAYGGGERLVVALAREFRRAGHAVQVLARAEGALLARCHGEGVAATAFDFGHSLDPRRARDLVARLRDGAADVVIAFDPRSARTAALAARLWRRRRGQGGWSLVYYHGLEGSLGRTWLHRYLLGGAVSLYVANAAALRDELLAMGWIAPERVTVIYGGIDLARIERADPAGVRAELGVPDDAFVLLVAGRLVADKGHALLLDVLAEIAGDFPRLSVWFAGEGPERAAIKRRIAELGLGGVVRLLGFRDDLPRLLRAADLLCHPSRREGIPNVVREAMAAGLPVVATAASGTPELVRHGETGLLSPVDDRTALAANLVAVLRDAELRRRLGEAGRARARAEFSDTECARQWLERLAALRRREGCR